MSTIARPPIHRWDHEQWDRMVESGVLEGQRVELIGGEIVDRSPQREPHVVGISLVGAVMRRVFLEPEFWVRVQSPLRVNNDSEPEPDVAVVTGSPREYLKSGHPRTAAIVVEVAETSLEFDRADKASLYAAAGIADYWILNLVERQCEVHRKPVKDAKERFGFRYSRVTIYKSGDSVATIAAKNTSIAIADLLP